MESKKNKGSNSKKTKSEATVDKEISDLQRRLAYLSDTEKSQDPGTSKHKDDEENKTKFDVRRS